MKRRFSNNATLLEAAVENPAIRARAEEFLLDAHGHGARGVDALHAHAVAVNEWREEPWDAITVAVAIAMERERAE